MSPFVLQAWLIIIVTVWKLFQLARSRLEFPLIAVNVALVGEVLGQCVPDLLGDQTMIALLGERGYRATQACLIIITLLALNLFFQSSARAATLTRRRLRGEAAVAAVALLATIVTVTLQPATLPVPTGTDSASSSVMDFSPGRIEALLPYYLVSNLYYVWATGASAWYALAAARKARSYLRAGLTLAGTALVVLGVAVAMRLVSGTLVRAGDLAALAGVKASGPLIFVGLTAMFIGVAFPAVGTRLRAGKVWVDRRRMLRQLEPLARRLRDLFPEVVMRPQPGYERLERVGLWRVGQTFYRCVIEIHDALLQLSRYLDPAQVATGPLTVETQAQWVVSAARAHALGRRPGDHAVDLEVAGATTSLDEDGRALVQLARALTGRLPSAPGAASAAAVS